MIFRHFTSNLKKAGSFMVKLLVKKIKSKKKKKKKKWDSSGDRTPDSCVSPVTYSKTGRFMGQLWRPTKVGVFTGSCRNLQKALLWTYLCPYTKFHWDTTSRTGCRSRTKCQTRAFGATLATHQSRSFHRIGPKPTKGTSLNLPLSVYQISFGYD